MLSSLNILVGKISPGLYSGGSGNSDDDCVDDLSLTSPDPTSSTEQPDSDYIKMFVGQIPKSMNETQLTAMFEAYGRVHSINILRNKLTGLSKGCCFVTYFTRKAALKAQDALHNIKTLDGMLHPIQMKPADTENRNERKLFIGMLNKKLNENDVRMMFDRQDTIEECVILRDQNNQSKGCAFVTFYSKQSASHALKRFNHNKIQPGSPTVLKFADTQKDKELKKFQQIQMGLWNSMLQGCAKKQVVPQTIEPKPTVQFVPRNFTVPHNFHHHHHHHGHGTSQQISNHFLLSNYPSDIMTTTNPSTITIHPTATATPLITSSTALMCLLGKPNNNIYQRTNQYLQQQPQQFQPSISYQKFITSIPAPLHQETTTTNRLSLIGKQIEGPPGCNLFIYHLPQDFTDLELTSSFMPYGNIISAKVFIDKQTNLSKCFGFVSYDSSESAHLAIRAMNGYQIGIKRLKVQLKKPRESSKPY